MRALNVEEKQMVKKIGIAGLVLTALLAGCFAARTPSKTVEMFYNAVAKNDIKAMGEVATLQTTQIMAMFGSKASSMIAANGKISNMEEQIDGDTATVTVTFESRDEETIDLVKVDGKWKVSMSSDK